MQPRIIAAGVERVRHELAAGGQREQQRRRRQPERQAGLFVPEMLLRDAEVHQEKY